MQFKIYLSNIIISLGIIFFISTKAISVENKIVYKVENDIITTIDIEFEKKYLIALNPSIKQLDNYKLNSIAKNSLLREKIKEKEILKYLEKIDLNKKFLNQLIKERYSRLNFGNKDEFLNYLQNYNLKLETIEKKISIEALWNQLIYQKFSKNIKINKEKLAQEIEKKNELKEKNLKLSEIVFTAVDKNKLDKKYSEIVETINSENFESAALTYSISDSSKIGGKLGWIKLGSLNEKIKSELFNLNKGDISQPIFTPNGYLVLKIDDIKFIEKKYDKEKELQQLINLNTNQQLNQQSLIYFNKVKKDTNINEL